MQLQCLENYQEFQQLQDEWDEFVTRSFPERYVRSHVWLSAWWSTYHAGKRALVYLQRDQAQRITAAAPLLVRRESFGGFPVQMLQSMGKGLGSDDFMVGPDSVPFVRAVFRDLALRCRWDVATFRRISCPALCRDLPEAGLVSHADVEETRDFFLEIPRDYQKYLTSRSSKFRNNLLQATRRLQQVGDIALEVLDPFTETERVWELCGAVARQSWQYKNGTSHFSELGAASFYANLLSRGQGCGGEEFLVLRAGERPVAFLFGCRRGASYYLFDTAYDADFRNISVGRVLLTLTIQRLIENGVEDFNLEGGGEYKDFYATGSRPVNFLSLYNRSYYARCVRSLRNSQLYSRLKARWK